MSIRHHAQQQREKLRDALLQNYRDGVLRSGEMLPSVRELAKQYDMSPSMAHNVLKAMADEGLVQMRQGSGAYMVHLPEHTESAFAVAFGDELLHQPDQRMICDGFEREIARRAGTSVTLTPQTTGLASVLENFSKGQFQLEGAFLVPSYDRRIQVEGDKIFRVLTDIPYVVYNVAPFLMGENDHQIVFDSIRFDDFEGGRQATKHLLKRGHQKLAFLGLHANEMEKSAFPWSHWRERGFRAALAEVGIKGYSFTPDAEAMPSHDRHEQERLGQQAADALIPLIDRGEVKAVVCVNHLALVGLVRAAKKYGLPESKWPALIAFDEHSNAEHLLSVLRTPWDDLGRYAASALWGRAFGTDAQREAPPHEILVPMRLITRLSCAENYPTMAVADATYSHV